MRNHVDEIHVFVCYRQMISIFLFLQNFPKSPPGVGGESHDVRSHHPSELLDQLVAKSFNMSVRDATHRKCEVLTNYQVFVWGRLGPTITGTVQGV